MLWDQSSICTEQSNGKHGKVIKYLHINPFYPEEEKSIHESTEESYECTISIFEQISESKLSNASNIKAGCCFDCRKPHARNCRNMRWFRLSLVGLSD